MIHPIEITLVLICLLVLLIAIRAEQRKPRTAWRKVWVDREGRSARADCWYWVSTHGGNEVWITDEEMLAGKVRADGLRNHPHAYA